MRINRLSFCGLGPYQGEQEIDFTRLGTANGLFLLRGKTGAGKSTILDAITYALYRSLALGKNASEERLRSNFLPADQPSWIELDFEVAGQPYRVRRTLGFSRPKKRGAGETKVPPEAALWRLPHDSFAEQRFLRFSPKDAIANKEREVGQELSQLLPLTKEQFLQTVILPQGAFATFLTASSDERQKVLQRIFNTDIYAQITEQLSKESKAHAQADQKAAAQVLAAHNLWLQNWAEVLSHISLTDSAATLNTEYQAWTENFPADSDLIPTVLPEVPEFPPKLVESLAAAQEHAQKKLKQTQEQHRQAVASLEQQSQLLHQQRQYQRLQQELKCLEGQLAQVEEWQKQLGKQEKIALVAGAWQGYQQAVAVLSSWGGETIAPEQLAAKITENDQKLHQATVRASELKQVAGIFQALHSDRNRLAQIREEKIAARRRFSHQYAQLAQFLHRAWHVNRKIQKYAYLWDLLPKLERILERYQLAAEVAAELSVAEQQCQQVKVCLQQQQQQHQKLQEQFLAEYQQTLQVDAVFLLREKLVPGEACPVCQQTVSQLPAGSSRGDISSIPSQPNLVDLLSERSKLQKSAQKTGQLLQEVTNLETQISALQDRYRSLHPQTKRNPKQLQEIKQRLLSLHKKFGTEQNLLPSLNKDAQLALADLKAQRQTLHLLTAEEQRIQNTFKQRLTQLKHFGLRQESDLAAAREENNQLLAQLQREQTQWRKLQQAYFQREQAQKLLATQFLTHGWEQRDEKQSPEESFLTTCCEYAQHWDKRWSKSEVDRVKTQVSNFEKQLFTTRSALKTEEIQKAAALGEKLLDLSPAQQAVDQTRMESEAANLVFSEILHMKQNLEKLWNNFSLCWDSYQQQIASHATLLRLEQLASGKNIYRTPLATWVLKSRLEEVLDLANPYLLSVSSGQYRFRRQDTEGSRRINQALTLAIEDLGAGTIRPVTSLSGGESFYCSLSLALGLSEVVTAQAGGVEIGTMFIDEGFGSLDEQTRDLVLSALQKTSRAGRKIGLISHVGNLQEVIADQVVIHRCGQKPARIEIIAD